MAGSTTRLGLYKPGGGSSEDYGADEVIDVDRHNDNFDKIDAAIGAPGYTSASRPSNPYDGQLIWETDTGLMRRWNDAESEWETMQTTPTGVVADFAGATAPSGWLICDGASLSRVTYAALFAVLGTTYGSVDSTHFTLPNAKGRVSVGLDSAQTEFDALGETGGAKTVTLTVAQMPAHNHPGLHRYVSRQVFSSGSVDVRVGALENGLGPSAASAHSQGADSPHPNLQPYITLNKIIKF